MLKLKFNIFQEKLKLEKQRGYRPTEHCMVKPDGFKFIIRSQEEIMYSTTMSFEDINTYAELNDMEPVEAFDMFMINYCSGTLQLEPDEEDLISEYTGEEEQYKKSLEIDAGDDVIIEAKDYSDFLLKFFDNMKTKVLKAVDKIDKSYVQKNMGKFLQDLFNGVNTVSFGNQVKRYIKIDLVAGMMSAEVETDSQIGFTEAYTDKMNLLASNQIDGYTINGKKWPGIKGVTKEVQAKVIATVQEGINANTSLKDIKERVNKEFDGFSDWRANTIARTETTHIINEGKLTGYKETKIDGVKVWDTAPYEAGRSSEICQRLNGQRQELDNPFIDPKTRKAFMTPGAHPNCRSTIHFEANFN
jgi:SPP1 gp7 family putative phage head morphogenesis protein